MVGGEDAQGRVERFERKRRFREAAGNDVRQRAESGFDLGYLLRVLLDKGFVRATPCSGGDGAGDVVRGLGVEVADRRCGGRQGHRGRALLHHTFTVAAQNGGFLMFYRI